MTAPATLNHLFFDAVDRYSTKRAALRYKAGGVWHDITHQDLARRVHHAAIGLRELGIGPGERVAILSANRAEWAITDYACLTARCPGVAVHAALTPKQVAYILNDSGAKAVFVEDQQQYAKVAAIRGAVPGLQHVIAFGSVAENADAESFQHFMQRGAAAEARYPAYREEALAAAPDDLATLIYTSGTTGEPKGVMLTHGNFTSNVVAALKVLRLTPEDSCLSFLPLSHSLERMGGHYTMFHAGATICYAESFDTIASNLVEIRPTVVIGVPRVFEKIHGRVVETAMRGGAVKRRVFFWTQRVGRQWVECMLARKPAPRALALKWRIADRLVYAKLRAGTGGRIRYFVSGGAPLSVEVATFFFAARLPVLEGYGLSETSPVVTLNSLEAPRLGSVGKPIAGVEVRIAPDGEILVRGPNVMAGYYHKPQATSEVLDADGWFHTGDVGELDPDGYLRITDRKKDLIKTAGGKYVAPQLVENLARTSPFVLNCLLLGERRPYPILLVVPNADAVRRFAHERGLQSDSIETLLSQPDIVAKVEREVMLPMRDLAKHEMPKKVVLIPQDFTIENGLLTPSMKVKRKAVEQQYQEVIEAAYQR